MPICYVAIGSNMGNRDLYIQRAIEQLQALPEIRFRRCSPLYETEPVGMGPDAGSFLNGAIEIETRLAPHELLQHLQATEFALGRLRENKGNYTPRTVDLDLLLYGEQVIHQPGLEIPHPRMHQRWFVLKPLSKLCPEFLIPGQNRTVAEALAALETQGE